MKLEIGTTLTGLGKAEKKAKCPRCHTAVTSLPRNAGRCPACGAKVRICPYCEQAVLESEDPCHYCGLLEPAVFTPENRSYEVEKSDVLLLLLGVAMTVWGVAIHPNAIYCGPDDISGCFRDTGWAIPVGISLVTVCICNILWVVLPKLWRKAR